MRLANTLEKKYISVDITARTKKEAVDQLLKLLANDRPTLNIEDVKKSISEREEIENTSYGRGFAFPHARTDSVDDMYVLIGVSKDGLIDETPDNIPVSVIVVLLTPSHISKIYLQILSAFATVARIEGNLEKIKMASDANAVIELIRESGVSVDKELKVKDIMRRDVETVTISDTLKDVANRMFRKRLSGLAVVDDDGNLLGQIRDKDLITAALPDYKTLISNLNYSLNIEPFEELLKQEDKIKVAELYNQEHETTTVDSKIVEVSAMMIFKDVRRVFVVEGKKLVGVLLRKDIVSTVIRG